MPTQSYLQVFINGVHRDELLADQDHLDLDLRMDDPSAMTATWRASPTEVGADIGAGVEVRVVMPGGRSSTIFVGTITSVQIGFSGRGSTVTVLAQDDLFKLGRGRVSSTWTNVKVSDVVKRVLANVGAKGNVTVATTTHDVLVQHGETDLDFLLRLGAEIGSSLWVTNGTCHFAPITKDTALDVFMEDVIRLDITQNAGHLVEEVEVHYWDPATKKNESQSSRVRPYKATEGTGKSPKDNIFGWPVPTAAAAKDKSKALAELVDATRTTMQATLDGDARLVVGVSLKFKDVPEDLDADVMKEAFFVSRARHRWDPERGYTVEVDSAPHRDLSLGGLTNGRQPRQIEMGVVPAIVTSLKDPEAKGRVKVTLPWPEEVVTTWARVAMPGAGEKRGLNITPEVGDEVFIAFQYGDMRQPVIMGGAYNGKDKTSLETIDTSTDKVTARTWYSRLGHHFVLDDDPGTGGITVSTSDKKNKIHIEEKKGSIVVTADKGGITLETSSGDLTLKGKNITIDTPGNVKMNGNTIKVKANAACSVEGANVDVKAQAKAKVSGNAGAELSSAAMVDVKGGAMVQVKGALVKIN